ncbi:hypothetical protein ACOSQ3_021337 [Xanthoceras sorbifolium]
MVQGNGAQRSATARRRRKSDAAVQAYGAAPMATWGGEGTSSGVANGPAARRRREEAMWEKGDEDTSGDGDMSGGEGAALETQIVVKGSEAESSCGKGK